MASTRRAIDVEDLVSWACGELARKRPGATGKVHAIHVGREDRSCLGRWGSPMGYPPMSPMFAGGLGTSGTARGDPPHPDALIVEACFDVLRPAQGGMRADDEDLAAVTFGLGFDDLEADKALRVALANARTLLIVHGRLGKRPAIPPPCEPSAELAGNGKPGVWRREIWAERTWNDHAEARREVELPVKPTRKDLYPPGSYCKLEWTPAPRSIVMDRANYRAWFRGLAALAEALRGQLETREALPPAAEAAPWVGAVGSRQ